MAKKCSLSFAVLDLGSRLPAPKLGDLGFYGLLYAALKFTAVPELEQELKPHEQRRKEDSLD